jgi:uncharacterized protein (DUF305 family)
MKVQFFPVLLMMLSLFFPVLTSRAEPVEPSYNGAKPRVTTPFYGSTNAAARQADLDFIAGMRPHHAGALTMSDDYLKSADARQSKLIRLARGIIHNQEFEIGMLDMVKRQIDAQSTVVAWGGQAQKQRFFRAPIPGPLDGLDGPHRASARDVQFAKAMIVHHQAALDMAYDYLNNPEAKNPYLRKMAADILFDQQLEIDFMNNIIETYPGDANLVKIDSSMVHGMDHMRHGSHKAVPVGQKISTQKSDHDSHH